MKCAPERYKIERERERDCVCPNHQGEYWLLTQAAERDRERQKRGHKSKCQGLNFLKATFFVYR
jgi:hypothetical protein